MAFVVMAYIVTAYAVMACIVTGYAVMAYIVMACAVMAYIVMAFTVMTWSVGSSSGWGTVKPRCSSTRLSSVGARTVFRLCLAIFRLYLGYI